MDLDKTVPPHSRLGCRWRSHSLRQTEAVGITSISLSPAGEGSLLRLDRPRSFPSEARGGLSASPSFAGVEGPLCVLYSAGEEREHGHIRSSTEHLPQDTPHQHHLTPKRWAPEAAPQARTTWNQNHSRQSREFMPIHKHSFIQQGLI